MCFFGGGDSGQSQSQSGSSGLSIQTPASSVDPVVQQARTDALKRFRAQKGAAATLLTKSTGAGSTGAAAALSGSAPASGQKTLLGQ